MTIKTIFFILVLSRLPLARIACAARGGVREQIDDIQAARQKGKREGQRMTTVVGKFMDAKGWI